MRCACSTRRASVHARAAEGRAGAGQSRAAGAAGAVSRGRQGSASRRRRCVSTCRRCSTSSGLTTRFDIQRWFRLAGRIHAVEQVSLIVRHGETLALVGESGCGKSTTGRSIIRLEQPQAGEIRLNAEDVTRLDRGARGQAAARRAVCVPGSVRIARSAPDHRLFHCRTDPHASAAARRGRRSIACMNCCGWSGCHRSYAQRYPHEMSGGQRQRACIARALASRAQPDHRRRSGRGTRRVDPRAGGEPADGTAGAAWRGLSVHLARHGGGGARSATAWR